MLLIACVLVTAGCSSTPRVIELREFPTEIATGDEVAFLLLKYWESGREQINAEAQAAIEQTLFSCVSGEIADAKLGLNFIPPQAFREAAFLGEKSDQLPRTAVAILNQLVDGRTIGDHTMTRLRYVVLFEVNVTQSNKRPQLAGEGYALAVGMQWTRNVTQHATVLDIEHHRIAGRLSASSQGDRAVGVVTIIPFVVWTNPDNKACTDLGQALARFLSQ